MCPRDNDDDGRGQLRQRVRELRILVAARGRAGDSVAEQLADLELKMRHARVPSNDLPSWLRTLDETIAAIEMGNASDRAIEEIVGAIAAGLYVPQHGHR